MSLPSIYGASDIPALLAPNTSHYKPSPIAEINGEEVETWLNEYAGNSGQNYQQDPDANYNYLFPNIPGSVTPGDLGLGSYFSTAIIYQGTDTLLRFANGTTHHVLTATQTSQNFTEVTDGESFFKKFCTNNLEKGAKEAQQKASTPNTTQPTPISTQVPYKPVQTKVSKALNKAFPTPLVASSDGSIAGYIPESEHDFAVLAIATYGPAPAFRVEFQDVTRELLATAKAKGKKKLIVDLRGNPGGTVFLAYDTFRQLFPNMTPYGATNLRANDLFNWTGESISGYFQNATNAKKAKQTSVYAADTLFFGGSPFNFAEQLNVAEQDFASWQEFYGPHQIHNDSFTSLVRYNLSDPYQTVDVPVYGYGNDSKPQPQTFAAEDIVLLQDGACASTCTIFTEFMKTQAHVKQIVVGGRKKYGPSKFLIWRCSLNGRDVVLTRFIVQGVGGVKGAQLEGMSILQLNVLQAYKEATPALRKQFDRQFGGLTGTLATSTTQALNRAAPGGDVFVRATFNFRNNIRQNDSSMIPLQFVYEAADCRFFYTASMYEKQELVWDMTYKLAWGNDTCVRGSTGQPSSGFGDSYIDSPPPAGVATNDTIFPTEIGAALASTVSSTKTRSAGPTGSGASTESSSTPKTTATNGAELKSISVEGVLLGIVTLLAFL